MRKSAPLKELRKPQKHKIRAAVKQRFGGACAFCGRVPRVLTLDHVVAKSKGGLDVKWNLAAVCHRCNQSKGSRPLWEWWQASPWWDEERAARFAATVLVCQMAVITPAHNPPTFPPSY